MKSPVIFILLLVTSATAQAKFNYIPINRDFSFISGVPVQLTNVDNYRAWVGDGEYKFKAKTIDRSYILHQSDGNIAEASLLANGEYDVRLVRNKDGLKSYTECKANKELQSFGRYSMKLTLTHNDATLRCTMVTPKICSALARKYGHLSGSGFRKMINEISDCAAKLTNLNELSMLTQEKEFIDEQKLAQSALADKFNKLINGERIWENLLGDIKYENNSKVKKLDLLSSEAVFMANACVNIENMGFQPTFTDNKTILKKNNSNR